MLVDMSCEVLGAVELGRADVAAKCHLVTAWGAWAHDDPPVLVSVATAYTLGGGLCSVCAMGGGNR